MANKCDLPHSKFSLCKPLKTYMLPPIHLHNSVVSQATWQWHVHTKTLHSKTMLIIEFGAHIQVCRVDGVIC